MPGAFDRSRKSAVVRSISSNYSKALSSYFGTRTPDSKEAQGSHEAYVTALRAHGTEVTILPELPDFPDSCFVEDTAVSPEKLPEYVRRFDSIVRSHNTTAGYYGHASVGCLHIRPMINIKTESGLQDLVTISEEISDLVLEFNGSLSGEHGDGIVRGVWTEKMLGPTLYQAFKDFK